MILLSLGSLSGQTVSTAAIFSGFQACGGCTVCGNDYWCVNTPGSYCGNTAVCRSVTFPNVVPPGNIVVSMTIRYFTASCYGASIQGSINGLSLPLATDGNTGCLCSSLPCIVTTTVTANYPCGMPGYIYTGNNTFQMCSNGPMCINRAEMSITYVPEEQLNPEITASGPLTICAGESVTLTATSGYSSYSWSTGENTPSINVSTPGTYIVTVTSSTGCSNRTSSATVAVNPIITPAFDNFGPYCEGVTPNNLPSTSNNGVAGTWAPPAINTSSAGTINHTFTPDAGQCATTISQAVTVDPLITPTFDPIPPFCEGATPPVLPAVSNNGISGTWNPPLVSNTAGATYIFTPSGGNCINTTTLSTTVSPIPATLGIFEY